MNFHDATDELFARVTHADLARELGVSIALIRQGRLRWSSDAHRSPPKEWQCSVAKLADKQAKRYARLAAAMRDAGNG